MNWTETKPTSGYHWHRTTPDAEPVLMRIVKGSFQGRAQCMAATWQNALEPVDELGGEWYAAERPPK